MRSYRIDRIAADLSSPVEGPAGALFVEGYAARPGIYRYLNRDGSIRRELVPRDRLWDPSSMLTLGRAPLTLDHPPVMVNDENVKTYMVGDVDPEIIEGEGGYVRVRLAVRTKDAKRALDGGKVELSPGYYVEVDQTSGVDPEFGEYDAIQVRRTYNHLAIVDAARGGPECRVNMDASDDVAVMLPEIDKMDPRIIAALKARGQADAFRTTLAFDSLVAHMNVQTALSDFWNTFWATFDALCRSMDEAMESDSPPEELLKIADELVAVVTDAATKFKETLATPEVAAPPEGEMMPEGEDGCKPKTEMDESPADVPPAETTVPAVAIDAINKLIEDAVSAIVAKIDTLAKPSETTKTDGVDNDRISWYKTRKTIESKADAAGVTYGIETPDVEIAKNVASAYGLSTDGLDGDALVAFVTRLPAASTKIDKATTSTDIPQQPKTIYGQG